VVRKDLRDALVPPPPATAARAWIGPPGRDKAAASKTSNTQLAKSSMHGIDHEYLTRKYQHVRRFMNPHGDADGLMLTDGFLQRWHSRRTCG